MTEKLYDSDGLEHNQDGPWRIPSPVWMIHGHNISDEVNEWMKENDITYPWDKETQVLFELRFVHVDRGSPFSKKAEDLVQRLRAKLANLAAKQY